MCWNWHILKFRLWSNHISVLQFFSSNLDLEKKKFSSSRISIRPLRVSIRDQPRTVLFKLNFFKKKFRLLNLNEVWIAINTWSLSLIFFFSSSLTFLPLDYATTNTRNQHIRGDVKALLGVKDGTPKDGACGTHKGEEKGEEERVWGSSKVDVGRWLDALETLGEIPLNRHEDWILFNLIVQVLLALSFLMT